MAALVLSGSAAAQPRAAWAEPSKAAPPVTAAAGTASAHAPAVRVQLFPEVTLPGRGLRVPAGSRIDVNARIAAAEAGRTVRLQVATGRSWTTVAKVRTRRGGAATLTVPTGTTGRATYRVLATRSPHRPAATSRRFTVTVRPPDTTPSVVSPATVPTGPQGPADAYSLFDTGRPGAVFRWNPCTPIRYRVHLDGATPALAGDVTEAIRRLSTATGLTFSYQGVTGYPGTFGEAAQAAWPADTDLLITVAAEAAAPTLAGWTVGYTTLTPGSWTTTDARILQAEVVLEREFVNSATTGFDSGRDGTAGLLLHELGHAVGLAHSSDDSQIMYPTLTDRLTADYQNGDLSGLSRVGSAGGCLT